MRYNRSTPDGADAARASLIVEIPGCPASALALRRRVARVARPDVGMALELAEIRAALSEDERAERRPSWPADASDIAARRAARQLLSRALGFAAP